MDRGHVKLWRKMIDDPIFYKPDHLQLFLYLLLRAAWKKRTYRGVVLKRGELSTGRKALAEDLDQKESSIYKRLQYLKDKEYITIKSNNKHSIVSICNYDSYQPID